MSKPAASYKAPPDFFFFSDGHNTVLKATLDFIADVSSELFKDIVFCFGSFKGISHLVLICKVSGR